jgi:hypothetical protein
MRKTLFAALAFAMMVGVAIVLPLSTAHAVEVFSAETELRQYNPEKSYGGYFMTSTSGVNYLMDMMGNVVHKWEGVGGTPQLMEDGNLWSAGQVMDWDGNILWSFDPKTDAGRSDLSMHHDVRRMWNKKLNQYTELILTSRTSSKDEIIAAGGDPSWDYTGGAKGSAKLGRGYSHDALIEVNMNKQIVWEWRFLDHAVQSKNPAWPNYVSDVKLAPGRFDAHWRIDQESPEGTTGICFDWHHVNSLDYNEDLDHIVVNAKHWSTYFVIDHGKTFVSTTDWAANRAAAKGPAGDVIYRFGNASAYNQGAAPGFQTSGHSQLFGSHSIQWIRPYHWGRPHLATDKWPDPVGYTKSGIALPGAGNFLIFDNRCYAPTLAASGSKVIEINPYLNAAGVNTGAYVNPPEAGYTRTAPLSVTGQSFDYINKQVVWSYRSKITNSFFAPHNSGMQRLPNGNTSIIATDQNHLFEVTPTGEIVWEYIWPFSSNPTPINVITDNDFNTNNIFRHYRYGVDYPGLAGRDLTPQGTLTGRVPRIVGSDFTYQQPLYGFGFGNAAGGGGGGAGSGSGGAGGGY